MMERPVSANRMEAAVEGDLAAPARRGRRALVLANRLPFPLDDGWKVRTFHMVRSVAAVSDSTTLVVFHPDVRDNTIGDARLALGARVDVHVVARPSAYTPARLLRGLVSETPVHVWNQESAALRAELRSLIDTRDFDLALSESTFMYRYMDLFAANVPRVVDTHNIDSVTFTRYARTLRAKARRWYAAQTARKLRRFEAQTFAAADAIWVCSDDEAGLVREMAPGANVWTVPNGVDTAAMAPRDDVRPVPGRLVFFGRLDYFPNVDAIQHFAAEILPRLSDVPDLELHLVGAAATAEVRALAERTSRVRLIGRVDEVARVLASAAVVVVPLRVGGGTRIKILEALSMARPLVSTTIGAEGLRLGPGHDLLIADEPDDFARSVRELLNDPARAETLGRNGRETVRANYDWTAAGRIVARSLVALNTGAP
jgi:glycosyltransferase involved in cell wall biosynthesis